MNRVWRCTAVCGLAVLLSFVGCGPGDGLIDIRGMVTYDGQPLKKGTLMFQPAGGNGPTAAAIVANGKYSVKVGPGQKQVRIEGFKILGQEHYIPNDPTSPMVDIQEQILPARYNTQSSLTSEIKRYEHVYDFNLDK
jgi:hypothetical protein